MMVTMIPRVLFMTIKDKVFREVVKIGEAWTIKVGIKQLIGYMDQKKTKIGWTLLI